MTFTVNTTHDTWASTCMTPGTVCSLRAAVFEANMVENSTTDPMTLPVTIDVPAGTYDLSTNSYFTGTTHLTALVVTAADGVVIKGAGQNSTIIDNITGTDRVFSVGDETSTFGSLDLETLTVSGGSANYTTKTYCDDTTNTGTGGNIIVCGITNALVLNHVTVRDGRAWDGGGILVKDGSLLLETSTVSNNKAVAPTSTNTAAGGGITVWNGNIVSKNSNIDGNSVTAAPTRDVYGGGVYVTYNSSFTATGGSISHNIASTYADAYGGGIYVESNSTAELASIKLTGVTLDDNSAVSKTQATSGYGGAIYCDGSCGPISTSTFDGNFATGEYAAGGAIDMTNTAESAIFTNDVFSTNDAYGTDDYAVGGAIALTTDNVFSVTLTHVTMTNNGAYTYDDDYAEGGAVYVTGTTVSLIVRDSVLTGNVSLSTTTDASGGAIYFTSTTATLIITGSEISTNSTETTDETQYGAGIYAYSTGSVVLTDDTLSHNTEYFATGGYWGYGVAAYVTATALFMTGDTVSNNNGAGEGTVYVDAQMVSITSTTFADNTLGTSYDTYSYGVALETTVENETITNSTFVGNTSSKVEYGYGAIYADNTYLTMSGDTISGNEGYDPGFYWEEGSNTLADSVLSDNLSTDTSTGGIYLGKQYNCDTTSDTFVSLGGNYFGNYTLATTGYTCARPAATDTEGTDPMLAPLANNGGSVETAAPENGSALIGNGGTNCPATDAVGNVRPEGDCTVGALQVTAANGYVQVGADGGVFANNVPFKGSEGGAGLTSPVVGVAATPAHLGYFEVTAAGAVYAFGNAVNDGTLSGHALNKPIVGIAATPDGLGYYLVASDGGIFAYGDAQFHGSTGSMVLNSPIVGIATDKTGGGYWEVASDGGVFTFGNAQFKGSMGGSHLNKPIVGIAASTTTDGYWLVASDGGIFAFDAPFLGSMGGTTLVKPVVGIIATNTGEGYWEVASDGGVFSFGDAQFKGSEGGMTLNAPIVGIA